MVRPVTALLLATLLAASTGLFAAGVCGESTDARGDGAVARAADARETHGTHADVLACRIAEHCASQGTLGAPEVPVEGPDRDVVVAFVPTPNPVLPSRPRLKPPRTG